MLLSQVRVSQREILELVNSLVEEAGPWGILPDASEGSVCENECNYRTEAGLGSERETYYLRHRMVVQMKKLH